MSDGPENKTGYTSDDELNRSLAELAELVKPIATEGKVGIDAYFYLLLLWASFHVYPLEPPPGSSSSEPAKITTSDSGWKIFDYGDCLSTSPGENYGSYCTGKLITTAEEMIRMLAQRGITKVGFLGHDVARRAAWIECLEHNIAIINYEPTDFDWEVRFRILEARKAAEKVRQRVSDKTKRMEPD